MGGVARRHHPPLRPVPASQRDSGARHDARRTGLPRLRRFCGLTLRDQNASDPVDPWWPTARQWPPSVARNDGRASMGERAMALLKHLWSGTIAAALLA